MVDASHWSQLSPEGLDKRLKVIEDRVNNMDVFLTMQRRKYNDLEASTSFQIAALKGQIEYTDGRMRELSGDPMVASGVLSVKARRAMRPEAEDRPQAPLTEAQQALAPEAPGSPAPADAVLDTNDS